MERRTYTREFKLETVNMLKARGVSLAQAARDLDIRHTVSSMGQRNNAVQLNSRGEEAKGFSWACIEIKRHLIKCILVVG